MGALSGALAGFFFGVCAVLIQTRITEALIAKHGDSAVDHGASFLQPAAIITMSFLGSFLGLLYAFARLRVSWLARAGGLLFAALLTLVLLPPSWRTSTTFRPLCRSHSRAQRRAVSSK